MTDSPMKLADFEPLVGASFAIVADAGDLPPLTLSEATALTRFGAADTPRPPFSLVFDMAAQQIYDQGLYRLRHATLGDFDIFLVPMARDEKGVRYCATFN